MSTTVIFPGQGAQKIGMCKDFYDASEIVKDTFKTASDCIGYSMEDLCFVENEKLNLTEYTQPALLTCEIAMWNYMKSRGFKADYFAGHSLGEYSALVAANVINFSDAIKIVKRRGELMQRAVPIGEGSMKVLNFPINANVSATFIDIRKICDKNGVDLANINSPRQVVISGPVSNLQKAAEECCELFEEKLKPDIINIDVSIPSHSRYMNSITIEFKDYLKNFNMNDVSKVYSNRTGFLHKNESIFDNLVFQLTDSVEWVENMNNIHKNSDEIIEIGPSKPLSGFFKSLNINIKSIMILRQADGFLKEKGL